MTHIPIIEQIIRETEGLEVKRRKAPRSKVPFPTSEDLEVALVPLLEEKGFRHHEPLEHPTEESLGFEYDFWHPDSFLMVSWRKNDTERFRNFFKKWTRAGNGLRYNFANLR